MYRLWMKSNGSRGGHALSASSISNVTFGGTLVCVSAFFNRLNACLPPSWLDRTQFVPDDRRVWVLVAHVHGPDSCPRANVENADCFVL